MDKLIEILDTLYSRVSDAVIVYTTNHKFVYQNKRSIHITVTDPVIEMLRTNDAHHQGIETIDINNTKYEFSVRELTLLKKKLLVVVLSDSLKEVNIELIENVKHILSKTSVGDKTFYKKIGKLIQKELSLDNIQITIYNQSQQQLIIKYISNNHQLLRSDDDKESYKEFIQKILSSDYSGTDSSISDTSIKFENKLGLKHIFAPIISNGRMVGGVGVFLKDTNSIYTHHLESIVEYIGIFHGYQRLEETYLQQTSRLNAIFESSADLIWSVNRSMEVVSFNQNYYKAIFYKYQGGKVTEYFKNGESNTSLFDEFWEEKYQKVFTGRSLNFEVQLIHPDNLPAWKEVFLMPIFKADGNIEEISGIARDINEKKKTVFALHKEEEKFKQIFDSFQDLYVKIDLEGNINMISPSVESILGYSTSDIMGNDITDYYLYNVKTKGFFRKILCAKKLRNIEINLIAKNGRIIPCLSNLRVIYDDNNYPIAIESICRDITEITEANNALITAKDRLEVSLKAKEQFLANMSHEIRTPMNGMIGLLDMVLDTPLSIDQSKYLTTIKESSDLLLNLLNDILDLSKITASKLKINNEPLSIHQLLNNIKTLFATETEKKNQSLTIEVDGNIPDYLISDKMRLLQILSNLVSNAIKFTPHSGHVIIRASSLGKSQVKINVIDTGIGIKQPDINKLFNNFSQISESFSKQYIGAGLGLAISKELVQLLKGNIGVNSTYEMGSDFWFTFEAIAAEVNHPIDDSIEVTNRISISQVAHKSILIVDDNATNRLVASEILLKYGMSVDKTDNAETAIKMSVDNKYDVVLMDIQMPIMDGIEGMQQIKLNNPNQKIVAMTAYDEQGNSGKFVELGFNDYLAKPITPKTLINVINNSNLGNGIDKSDRQNEIDYEALTQLVKFASLETVKETLSQFASEITFITSSCQQKFKDKSYKGLSDILHSVKGDAGTIGLTLLSQLAGRIERNIDKEHLVTLDEDLNTLYLMLRLVPKLTEEIIKKLSHE